MRKIIVILLTSLITCSIISCGKTNKFGELQMKGSYYDNISGFKGDRYDNPNAEDSVESISDMAKSYLQSVTYEIKEVDEKNRVATLEVSVPNVSEILSKITSEVLNENKDVPYEELQELVQAELVKKLSDEETERTKTSVELPIEETDGEYKIVSSEQWEQIIFGSLEEAYIDYYRTIIGGLPDEIPE